MKMLPSLEYSFVFYDVYTSHISLINSRNSCIIKVKLAILYVRKGIPLNGENEDFRFKFVIQEVETEPVTYLVEQKLILFLSIEWERFLFRRMQKKIDLLVSLNQE